MMKIFGMFDKKAIQYGALIQVQNEAVARRVLIDTLRKPGPLTDHPEDFALYLLGTYDQSNGAIVSCQPKFIMEVLEAKDVVENGEVSK